MLLGSGIAFDSIANQLFTMHHLPEVVENELLPFVSDKPTSKESIIAAIKEFSWHKNDIKQVLNYLFGIPIKSFYKGRDGHIHFDNFSIE